MAYLACSCGDTLASEVGQLAHTPPRHILSFASTATGTDGAVSLLGTLMSLVGGALVGAAAGSWQGATLGALYGGIGSVVDSIAGAVLQPPQIATSGPTWARLNVLVNLLAGCTTAVLALAVAAVTPEHDGAAHATGHASLLLLGAVLGVVAINLLLLPPAKQGAAGCCAGDAVRLLAGALLFLWSHASCLTAIGLPHTQAPAGADVGGDASSSEQPRAFCAFPAVLVCAAGVVLYWGVQPSARSRLEAAVAALCLVLALLYSAPSCTKQVAWLGESVGGLLPAPVQAAVLAGVRSWPLRYFVPTAATAATAAMAMLLVQPLARLTAGAFRWLLVLYTRRCTTSGKPANELLVAAWHFALAFSLFLYWTAHARAMAASSSSSPPALQQPHMAHTWSHVDGALAVNSGLFALVSTVFTMHPLSTMRDALALLAQRVFA